MRFDSFCIRQNQKQYAFCIISCFTMRNCKYFRRAFRFANNSFRIDNIEMKIKRVKRSQIPLCIFARVLHRLIECRTEWNFYSHLFRRMFYPTHIQKSLQKKTKKTILREKNIFEAFEFRIARISFGKQELQEPETNWIWILIEKCKLMQDSGVYLFLFDWCHRSRKRGRSYCFMCIAVGFLI